LYILITPPHFDFNFFGHTSDTILNENFCPKKLEITKKNKND
jgi:hypothetical protein